MNRREALDILDRRRARDGSNSGRTADEHGPGADEVRAALALCESDPELRRIVDRREAFDRRAFDLMDDVDVPADLHGRLLAGLGLADATADETAIVTTSTENAPVTRRRWIATAVVASVAFVAAAIWWSSRPRPSAPTLFDHHLAAVDSFETLGQLPAFEGETRLPWTGWERGRIQVAAPRSLTVGGETVAAYPFLVPTWSGEPARGVLLAIPTDRLDVAPVHEYFDADDATYTRQFASVSWVEREWTFVCVVDDRATLEALARELDVVPA